MQIDLGFDRVLINDTNKVHEDLIGFFKSEIIDLENIDMTETLTNCWTNSARWKLPSRSSLVSGN